MMQLAVAGGAGRLGTSIIRQASRMAEIDVVAALTRSGDPRIGSSVRTDEGDVVIVDRLGVPCDVLLDVSRADATGEWLSVAERLEIPFVTGVTGHSDVQRKRFDEVARVVPVVVAPNFSVGMRVLIHAARRLASQLGDTYDIEIVETHHRHKADAPSGSAKAIVSALGAEDRAIYGREGNTGERPGGQVGVHAVRMGEVIGRHEVHFSGSGETLTLTHNAISRDVFALGALRAAVWVVEQDPGLYSMDDVIGLDAE